MPAATSTPEPTATPELTATPVPTATVAPVPTEVPTPTATPTAVVQPVAIRAANGAMLTVQGDGPPWLAVTPCFERTSVSEGLVVVGPVDVLIDPGHGGEETGAVGFNGLREADLNLKVAEALRERLMDAGYRVLMTRYSDERVAIQARAELANALQPRIFMSIHHNGGFPSPVNQPGTEIFVQELSEPGRRLGGLLFEEIQDEFRDEPIDWVGTDALGVSWRRNQEGTDLYGVLRRTPDLVSVLTEAMYLTADDEASFLATDEAVEREADALFRGIVRWFDTDDAGTGYIDGLIFRGDLGNGGGTEDCVDADYP